MPTRPTPTLADRAALTRGSADVNPFAGEGNPGDNFDIASFLRGDEFVRAEEILSTAAAAAPTLANAIASAPVLDARPSAAPLTPASGVIADVGTPPDRMIGTDGAVAFGSSAQATPTPDRAGSLAGDLARIPATGDEAAAVPAAAIAPPTTPLATLQGGPLIVQLDPVRAIATPVSATPPPIAATVTTPPVTASTPGFTLEWAPVLEAHGGAANAHVSIFDTNGDTDGGLLTALHELAPLPPITPPTGDGLGA